MASRWSVPPLRPSSAPPASPVWCLISLTYFSSCSLSEEPDWCNCLHTCSSSCPNQQEEGLDGAWPIKAAVSAVAAALLFDAVSVQVGFWAACVSTARFLLCFCSSSVTRSLFTSIKWSNNYRAALRADVRQEARKGLTSVAHLLHWCGTKNNNKLFILLQLFWQKSVVLHKLEASLSSINVTQQPSFTLNLQEWNIQPELQTHCTISTAFPTMNCG